MSVAQAARIPRGMSFTPPKSPVRSMLLSTSQSLKHQPAPTTISTSSGSATSVNLPQTRFDSVEAYHERQEDMTDKAYMTEEMVSPRSDTASEASEQMMPRRRVELEDFELIRVVGKGCAGRVSLSGHPPIPRDAEHVTGPDGPARPYTPDPRHESNLEAVRACQRRA